MDDLHKGISKKHSWYKDWHNKGSHALIHWLFLILVVAVCGYAFQDELYAWLSDADQNQVTVNLPSDQAVISIDPQNKSVKIGDTFSANIILNTRGGPIDAVDIYTLHYDPTLLQVIDDMPDQKGIQIQPGIIIPFNAVNLVNESTGTIKLGQASAGGASFTGQGVLATVHFKAIGVGTSFLKFDFNKGSTVDTNAAHRGKDKLAAVVDAIYTITK